MARASPAGPAGTCLVRLATVWSNAASSPLMDALIVLAVLALLAGPILAIVALFAVRRLSATPSLPLLQELTTRVYQLERQVARLTAAESKAEPPSPETKPLRVEIPSSPAPPPPAPTPQPAVSATPLEG